MPFDAIHRTSLRHYNAVTKTLLDLRGCVAVEGAQDFDAIRQKMVAERTQKASRDDD